MSHVLWLSPSCFNFFNFTWGEYMNRYFYDMEPVISEFTLALFEDLEFYKVNYYTGGLMRYGKNNCSDFLNKKCIN